MSKLSQQAKTTLKKKGYTTTTSSTGPYEQRPTDKNNSSRLKQLLLEVPGVSLPQGVTTATTPRQVQGVQAVGHGTNTSGPKATTTQETYSTTSQPRFNYIPTGTFVDLHQNRGERITIHTLADYCSEHGIYSPEDFMHHATQIGPNRGREIYRALSLRDWEKKLSQAIDFAQSYTPDTPFRTRVESYQIPSGFDLWKGTATYHEYMELFKHHGIGIDKLRRFFKTLCGDNGKINTIYMWGKADAGKTTIIKLFDAFYAKWEIGRCSAQNINSNFWLQDLYMKRLFHADEIMATQVNIDTLKLLLEGSDDLTTDIKYAKKVSVRGRPVMMATNDPIWINMSSAADPIKKRCEFVQMVRPWTKPAYFMSTRDKDILKYVQNRIWKDCFPEGYEAYLTQELFKQGIDEITDEEMSAIIEGPPVNLDDFIGIQN